MPPQSHQLIIIKIPTNYINITGGAKDYRGEQYLAFMTPHYEGKETINYLDPKFIFGVYDASKQAIIPNSHYETNISEQTLHKLDEGYKTAVAMTKSRLDQLAKVAIPEEPQPPLYRQF